MKKPIMRSGAFSFPLFLMCVVATFLSPTLHAQDNALKDLNSRCHSEMQRVDGVEHKKCPLNIKDQRYRSCIAEASAKSTKAYETCMGGTPQGACAGREFLNTSRSGVQGLKDRYCALRNCGYDNSQVAALDLTKGRMTGGTGADAIAVPPGFNWQCPGAAQPQQKTQAAAPAAKVGPDMGNCKSSPNFKSSGWKCADLKGHAGQFDKYDVPQNERICTSSQIDTMVNANDTALCSNVVEQREAVLKKYRDADAAIDMGNCKPSPKFTSTGWTCAALSGQQAEFDKLAIPVGERICTAAQVKTMIARKNDGNCSNVIQQGEVPAKRYRDQAAAAAAAATALALQPKIDMGKCKPAAGISGKGWDCRYVTGQFDGYKTHKVPQAEWLCTDAQAKALVTAANADNCGNVVVQANNLIDKYKKIADAAAEAAKPKVDMGNCKASPKFGSRGWECNAVKGQDSQFETLGIPAAERICTADQINALVAASDAAVCSNVVEQREAVLNSYRNKAKAAREAFMGKCKPAAGFDNTGFACVAVDAFLAEAAKYQVPAENRICTPEQAKALIAAKNDGHCSNVARQIAAATKRHRDAVAAAPKASPPAATATKAPVASPPPAQSTAAAKVVDMGRCKPAAGIDGKGWDCRQVMGAFDEYTKYNVPVAEQLCSREQATALVAAKNDANCGNVVVQVGKVLDTYRAKAKAAAAPTPSAAKAVDTGRCKPVAGIDSRGWDCRQVMGAFDEYTKYNVPVAEQLCSREQATALVAARNDANCGNVVVQVNKVLDTYRAAAKAKAAAANAVDMGRCKPAAGIDGRGWDCRQVMGAFDEYTKYNVPVADQLCSRAQATALVAARNDANCGNVVVQVNKVLDTYRAKAKAAAAAPPPATAVNTMTINLAIYGRNCPSARNADVTSKVKGACDGKEKCPYTVNVGVLGDTAPGCAKTFEAEYTCPGKGKRQLSLAAEAHTKLADFNCTAVAAPPPATAVNTMTINLAIYGRNCPSARNADVTSKVKGACDGKEKCPYTVNVGVLGDTAPGCAKTFEAEYTCPGKGKRQLSLAAEAHTKLADFNCSK